ncbi:MAG: ribosome silencing factor [Desulfuromonadales bacterium C00003093]|nr:MAG: ribosome silencing factor [Desulfuromonadales bacterium C00003093]
MFKGLILQARETALKAIEYALDKKGFDLKLLEVIELSSLTDYLLLVSGRSDRQVQAIAENIKLELKNREDLLPLAIEGMSQGRWVLLDYGGVMVHVFQQSVREFYDLEGLWSEAPEVPLERTDAG